MTNYEYNLYFFDIKRGKPLRQLLLETGQNLHDDKHLFKFWAKELLYAFSDLTNKSTYTIKSEITLRNVYVSDLGIKVFLKHIKFGALRDETIEYHLAVNAKMLNNYAKLLIEMLSHEPENLGNNIGVLNDQMQYFQDQLNYLEVEPELKAILYECLHAEDKILERD